MQGVLQIGGEFRSLVFGSFDSATVNITIEGLASRASLTACDFLFA